MSSFLSRLTLAASLACVPLSGALAEQKNAPQVPNGTTQNCALCHQFNNGGGLNVFGRGLVLTPEKDIDWPASCGLDADEDGYTNGAELGDPECVWVAGQAPAEPFRSQPGDPASVPGELPPEPDAAPPEPEPGEPEPGEPEPGEPEPPPDGAVRDDGGVNAGGTVISLDDGCAIDPAAPTHWPWLLAGIGGFAAARRRRR